MATLIFKNHISNGLFARTFRRLFGLRSAINPLIPLKITSETTADDVKQFKTKAAEADEKLKSYSSFVLRLCGIKTKNTSFFAIVKEKVTKKANQSYAHLATAFSDSTTIPAASQSQPTTQKIEFESKQPKQQSVFESSASLATSKSYLIILLESFTKPIDEIKDYLNDCRFETTEEKMNNLKPGTTHPWAKATGRMIKDNDSIFFTLVSSPAEIKDKVYNKQSTFPLRVYNTTKTVIVELNISQQDAENILSKKQNIMSHANNIHVSSVKYHLDINNSYATDNAFVKLESSTLKKKF